jgi:ubiquinone/menaquinone biosynthesis C-methylase UbiE
MDAFIAATYVGPTGQVVGVDMTDAQRAKANQLRDAAGLRQVSFVRSYIEQLPFDDGCFDCVISNGVINLVADKAAVFREAARVLKPGGRIALSDIVTSVALPPSVTCNVTLWAACVGGAMHREDYQKSLQEAGFAINYVQPNPQYQFLQGRAQRSAEKYQVASLSLIATRG